MFQRTAQFTIPAANGPLDPDLVALWKPNYPEWRRRGRFSRAASRTRPASSRRWRSAPEERRAAFEGAWDQGGFMFASGTFRDIVVNEEANKIAADFVKSKIDEIVHDPAVADMLKPSGFPFGTKRLPLDTNYYETFNRPNVTLVDLRADADRGDHPGRHPDHGRRARAGRDRVRHRVRRADRPAAARSGSGAAAGRPLADAWAHGPVTYLGWPCRASRTCSPSPARAAPRC